MRLLSSTRSPIVTGSMSAVVETSLLPPTWITSSTHPDPSATYEDGAGDAEVHWFRPFSVVAGYYVFVSADANAVASQTSGKFQTGESVIVPRASLNSNGTTYVHVVSVDAGGNVSTDEARFSITLSGAVPSISSDTHPDRSQWPNRSDARFTWTLPLADSAYASVHYVLDHYGTTVPTKSDTTLPVSQKQLFFPNLANGVWALHLLGEDKSGNLTSNAAHYVFNIGPNPGVAAVLGTVTDTHGPIAGAGISVNRGLFSLVTNASGTYNFQQLPPGTWEIAASHDGSTSPTHDVTVAAGGWQRVDFAF